jgi:hypothetical protein
MVGDDVEELAVVVDALPLIRGEIVEEAVEDDVEEVSV